MNKAAVGLCTVATLGACTLVAHGGTVFSDNFDSYATGSVADGQGVWEGWAGDSAAAQTPMVDDPAVSAPNSVEVGPGADLIGNMIDLDMTSGVFRFTGSVYVPSGHDGQNYFMLLNAYDGGGAGTDWSVQVHFDGSDQAPPNQVVADFSGETTELLLDQWVALEVIVNLDVGELLGDGIPAGRQEFKYNGETLYVGPWLGQVGGFDPVASTSQIAVFDLFLASGTGAVYYDDLLITTVPPDGACCFTDGTCSFSAGEVDCTDAGGCFQGIAISCETTSCPISDESGNWILDSSTGYGQADMEAAGGVIWGSSTCHADTCAEEDDCGETGDSPDITWLITLPRDGAYSFSVCDADFDTLLFLGSAACSGDLASSDDECGLASEITGDFSAGDVYLTLEGFSSDVCGTFSLNIQLLCDPITESKGAVAETEACGDDTNGGCNLPVPAFEPIEVDVPIYGTHVADADAGSRDTDWFEIIITEDTAGMYTFSGVADRTGTVFGFVNAEGTGNCVDATGIAPFSQIELCGDAGSVTRELTAGTWWMFAAPQFGGPVTYGCGENNNYEVVLSEATSSCTPTNDLDGNGFVEFLDLLTVLSNWAPEGCDGGVCDDGDTDCNGAVEFVDLLNVLSNWDPQP